LQFGSSTESGSFAGQSIDNPEYAPETIDGYRNVTAGTAYHDLMRIASSIFSSSGKLRNPNPEEGADVVPPMSDTINNKIPEIEKGVYQTTTNKEANAGGRSVHANLDGSMEMSIGADTVDRKSIVLDLAGGVISHYGRDKNGRSLIHQTDGDVIVQVGGPGLNDPRFVDSKHTEDRPGRVEIHLNRPGENAINQKIIIDETGITIDVMGNGVFKASGDLTISAGGRLLMHGETAHVYGLSDDGVDGTRAFKGSERMIARNGREIL
jgi:hypothetical protein